MFEGGRRAPELAEEISAQLSDADALLQSYRTLWRATRPR
jgi:hypothetical protein